MKIFVNLLQEFLQYFISIKNDKKRYRQANIRRFMRMAAIFFKKTLQYI